MNISIKDVLISFVVGLVVFSLLMLIICVGIFKSEIDVATSKNTQQSLKQEHIIHKAVIFAVPQSNGEGLKMAVLALYDKKDNELLLSPVYGDYLMNYRASLSYVEGVYKQHWVVALSELFNSISGVEVSVNDIVTVQNAINFAVFKDQMKNFFTESENSFKAIFDCNESVEQIQFKDISIAVTEQITENTHQHISIINVDETVNRFKNIIG